MAITTVLSPAVLNFAGNPILVKATTDQSVTDTEKSFLRIVCEVEVETLPYRDVHVHKVELSCPVEDKGSAVFNLSDAFQTVILSAQSLLYMEEPPADNYGYVGKMFDNAREYRAYVSVYDVYLLDNHEQASEKVHVMPGVNQNYIYAIPGKLTDYEMLTKSNILAEDLVESKPLSRKPDMGVVYKGEEILVPMVSTTSRSVSLSVSVGRTQVSSSSVTMDSYRLEYGKLSVSASSDGEFSIANSYVSGSSGYYSTNTRGVHFLRFINGFGAVENIAVRAKDKLSYEVSGETHSLVQEISTRPTDRRYATKSQPVGVYELSSGYVPQRWAEWYVQELLTSPRVWIQIGGKWVPALIESEDDCVIYDRSKPEMPHVDFTLRLAIDGVTGCTW